MRYGVIVFFFLFFFKQKTAYDMRISDWSSDVCSSDLNRVIRMFLPRNSELERLRARARQCGIEIAQADAGIAKLRSSPPEVPDLADCERSFTCHTDCPRLSARHHPRAGFASPQRDRGRPKGDRQRVV